MHRPWTVFWLTSALLLTKISLANSMPFLEQLNEDSFEEVGTSEMENEDDTSTKLESDDIRLFQGDILPDKIENGVLSQGVLQERTWPNGVVPYLITPNINASSKKKIRDAMDVIESVSCIKFKERRTEPYFIRIRRTLQYRSCYSTLGMSYEDKYFNEGQPLQLNDGCYDRRTILHELMHALGFHHENSRTDRDDFVEIMFENIEDQQERNFGKTSDPEVTHLGTPYDYYSIMHYSWNAFASDKTKPTIKTRQTGMDGYILGSGDSLSSTDITEINKLYNCPGYSNRCCKDDWKQVPDAEKCVKLFTYDRNWADAAAFCNQEMGRLVSVKSSKENEFLLAEINRADRYILRVWLDGILNAEKKWIWQSDGSEFSYTNWNSGEPNDCRIGICSGNGESCLEMLTREHGKWNDQDCRRLMPYFCEKKCVDSS